jgi:hypothetical protein
VRRGRIVVLNPVVAGLAGRLVDVDAIAHDIEGQINDWLDVNGIQVASISTDNNSITITTVPKP